jgi:hypothetical protein
VSLPMSKYASCSPGARFAEGDAPDLHYRLMRAWLVRLASHLTRPQLRRLDQEDLLPSAWSNILSGFSSLSCLTSQIYHRKRCRRNRLTMPSPSLLSPKRSLLVLQCSYYKTNYSTLLLLELHFPYLGSLAPTSLQRRGSGVLQRSTPSSTNSEGSYKEASPRPSHPSRRSLSHVVRALLAAILDGMSSLESSSRCL